MHAEFASEKTLHMTAANVETLLWWHAALHENGTGFLARKNKAYGFC
jgi:hypothetical protein